MDRRSPVKGFPKVWRDADVLCERVSTYAAGAASVCGAIRAAGNHDLLLNRLASDTKPGRIGRYRTKLSTRGALARGASSPPPDRAGSPTSVMSSSVPGTPSRPTTPNSANGGSRPGTPSRFGGGGGSGRSSPFGTPTRERSFNTRRRGSAPEGDANDGSFTNRSSYSYSQGGGGGGGGGGGSGGGSPEAGRWRPRSLRQLPGGFGGPEGDSSPTSSPGRGRLFYTHHTYLVYWYTKHPGPIVYHIPRANTSISRPSR